MATSRCMLVASAATERAVAEARLAYEFNPGSYTRSCLSACLAAEQAIGVLRAALLEQQLAEEGT
ncbi:hypothetical protein M2171_005576 [Bradyrhizobium japonicum USDA 38]|uniref:hypothetical protein n=1 Tax=Bradyrhizobium japonicum TaxID=375 RepID=UPI00041C4BB6|nr:hypothetical protein [Bradyrhizobium japonicum]MCS3896443.1 hypothetical protein [Bradyrhizobium japonicum USDA 38]MCS3948958.1 hypothetical protein [Bradyrhizobium japonicum]